jgi:hypothetical protein
MDNTKKKIKTLISGILADDTQKVETAVRDLSESIIPDRESDIMSVLIESFKGETDV